MRDVKVALRFSDSGTESLLLFFTGAVDLAYVGIVPFTMGLAYGLPLRIAAVAQAAGPSHAVVARRAALESGEPLRIATVFGSSGHFTGWHWARSAGVPAMFVDLSPQDQVRAFHQGYVHGVSTWEPHVHSCLSADAEVVFSAEQLPFAMLDLLVTSDAAAPRARDIEQFVALHRHVSAHLAGGPPADDVEYLQGLFRTRWTGSEADQVLSRAFTAAASEDLHAHLPDLEAGVAAIREFGAATGLGTDPGGHDGSRGFVLGLDDWLSQPPRGSAREPIRVGYSDDLMCAPLLLGRLDRMRAGTGLTFTKQPRREVERVAELSDSLRESVEQARELVPVDPALATIKMARLVELNLRAVADHVMGSSSPKQIAAVIAALEDRGVLPPLVATSAHWIRSVRNVAAHQEDLSEATATAAMTHLLDILEWLQSSDVTSERRCPRCSGVVEAEWVVCPTCTWQFERTCDRCGLALQTSWKACPGCGSPAVTSPEVRRAQ